MNQRPLLLTMGMPVFNEEKYIGEALESLLAQTYREFILIISDNASTDRTSEICKYYAAKDKRIVFVQHPKNKGAFFNFNYVLERADTPFFMWCGGHDKWHPQFIEKLLPLIQKEDLLLAYPQTREIRIDGTVGELYQDDYTTTDMEKSIDRYLYILKNIGKCNAFHGIWKTQVLKNCYFKPIISNDTLVLLQVSFLGKFKQYKFPLFFRRTIRGKKNKYHRQFHYITIKNSQKTPSIFTFSKINPNLRKKMLYRIDSQLNIISKLILSIQTTYMWIKKFYITPFLVKFFKKILPNRAYLFLKDRVKKYL